VDERDEPAEETEERESDRPRFGARGVEAQVSMVMIVPVRLECGCIVISCLM
jgi:hypothetical protein